jgi:hypothetical protein
MLRLTATVKFEVYVNAAHVDVDTVLVTVSGARKTMARSQEHASLLAVLNANTALTDENKHVVFVITVGARRYLCRSIDHYSWNGDEISVLFHRA